MRSAQSKSKRRVHALQECGTFSDKDIFKVGLYFGWISGTAANGRVADETKEGVECKVFNMSWFQI